MNPELICPPYILWPRRVRAGSDPSSPDPRPVVPRPVTHRRAISAIVICRATRHRAISAVVARATPVVARPYTRLRVLRTCRRLIFFKFLYPSSRATYSSSRPFLRPPRTHPRQPYKYVRVFFFPELCKSIPACTCHGDCLRDSPRGANYFSLHVIHHH